MNKLLIVDDDTHMVRMLRIMLEAEGYSVDAARNGLEALEKMKSDLPSLVLLDYMMPGMDGLDVLKELKKRHGDIGVIVITGHGSERLAVEMMKAGALHYIQKPFSRDELLRTVRQTLSTISAYKRDSSVPRILVVDDDETILHFVTECIEGMGEIVTTPDSTDALTRLGAGGFDVLLTDIYMPRMDGIELLRRGRVISPSTDVIVMTSSAELDMARRALKEGASDYIKKPFSPAELKESVNDVIAKRRKDSFERLKKRIDMQEAREAEQFESTLGIVEALIAALEARDPYTRGHSERVTEYSVGIAMEIGLSKREIELVRHSARLHDLGKIGTQDTHLYKATGLSKEEMEMVARHPEIGCNILRSIRLMEEYIPGIRHHHERYDGYGYPARLKGDSIPLAARIISVADAFDAMTSSRPYREGMTKEYAVEELTRHKGIQFDPSVVSAFVGYIMKGKLKKG